jgi:hypothetical protein
VRARDFLMIGFWAGAPGFAPGVFSFLFFFFLVILVFELRGSCLIPGDAKKEGKEGKKEERKEGRKEGREKKCLFFIYSS